MWYFCLLQLMHIESLKIFCNLVETESFTKAAHINGVTQSAISQQIAVMERLFKSPLVERSKKRFRLTNKRQTAFQLRQTNHPDLRSNAQPFAAGEGHHRRQHGVATVYSIGLHDLPPYVKKFMRSYPTVNVQVESPRQPGL